MQLRPNFIVDRNNRKIAVQFDIETYEKIKEKLKNYTLFRLMEKIRIMKNYL